MLFNEIKERYSPNTIWEIFSCRFGVNIKQLPHPKKFLKLQASKDVAKKSKTFSHQEIEKVLLHLQEIISPTNTLYGIAISLLNFGLLRAKEVREVKVNDVALLKERGNPIIEMAFTHNRKRQNNGFKFYVLHQYYPMYLLYGRFMQKDNQGRKSTVLEELVLEELE